MSALSSELEWTTVKALAADGDVPGAYAVLKSLAKPSDDFPTQRKYARWFEKLPKDGLELRRLKVAILAASTTDHFAEILKLWLALEGFDADIYLAPFGQTVQNIVDPASPLHSFAPDVVWLFGSHRDIRLDVEFGASRDVVAAAVADSVAETVGIWQALQSRLDALVVQNNADIPALDLFGHYEANVTWSPRNLLRRYNLALAEQTGPGVALFDLDHVSACYGKKAWSDPRYWYHSKHAFTFHAAGMVAFHFARLIAGAKGLSRKCLVLDLDNTLWGGVIGDDGLDGIKLGAGAEGEAFADFQNYIRRLKDRGIILAVCSKNEDINAREPFLKHPSMRLKLDDIAVFRANWDNKADNIRHIATTLNIGLDSLVFVDDNPAERALVRDLLPMVAVPELPADPSRYADTLHRARLFETLSFSLEDGARNEYYRANASRDELKLQFADLGEYQKSLKMVATVGDITSFGMQRSAQLINKSNQFHLTNTRYGEAELAELLKRPDWTGRHFSLVDRFGDNGQVSVVLLRREGVVAHIDTWVMSCRVLGRGMEEFIANEVSELARTLGCETLIGHYVPSAKNHLVSGLYPRLGFTPDGTATWRLDLASCPRLTTHIARG